MKWLLEGPVHCVDFTGSLETDFNNRVIYPALLKTLYFAQNYLYLCLSDFCFI